MMVGCDLHYRSMLVFIAVGQGKATQKSFSNDELGRTLLIEWLREQAAKQGADRIVLAYEASGLGFGLYDFLFDHGIECFVLSPSKLPKTPKSAKQKTDAKDAQMLLEQLRGHLLAGNPLPIVWTPPQRLRDDRELVRARVDAADETTRIKFQILSTLKRYGIAKPAWYTPRWSGRFVKWLREKATAMDSVVASVLESLIERYELYQSTLTRFDREIKQLSKADRYKKPCQQLLELDGVGLLSAMTFLTEIGDAQRFRNRRELAAYLGLCPSCFESGDSDDRKGRITRQGPSRLRKILCQASWVSLNRCEDTQLAYNRIKGGKKDRAKKALVAIMRRLAIKMWHIVADCGTHDDLRGYGGPHSPLRPLPAVENVA
jgi:transposase